MGMTNFFNPSGHFDHQYDDIYTYNHYTIKPRKRTSKQQREVLEKVFATTMKPDTALRRLAENLTMTPREVQIWFQNRRAKEKKLAKKVNSDDPPMAQNQKHNTQSFSTTWNPKEHQDIEISQIGLNNMSSKYIHPDSAYNFNHHPPTFHEWQSSHMNENYSVSHEQNNQRETCDEEDECFRN